MSKPKAYVGTAGWSIPSQYKEALPGGGSHLERYAQRLSAVEINSSFYRHHRVQTYERWAASVPAHFRFSVKLPRALTHDGRLASQPEVLDRFVEEVRGLGKKLAVLLVQLPPSLQFNESLARSFFRSLRKRIDVHIACEPRHPSWGSQRVDRALTKWAVTRVAADPPLWPAAEQPGGCRELAYFRWHGQPRQYYSDYEQECLSSLREQITLAGEQASQVWAIFDNTVLGCALGNALEIAPAVTKGRAKASA